MRMHIFYEVACALSISLALGACGGATPAAEEAEGSAEGAEADSKPKKGKKAKKAKKAKDSEEEASDKADKKDAKDDAPSTDGPKFTRTARDILSAPDVVFMFSFNDSDPKKKADEKCENKDAKKQNECLAKERKKFDNIDGFRFLKDDKGEWWWITVRKKGAKLIEVHKVQFDFGKEEETSVSIKPTGRDRGTNPWANPPREVEFGVPNDYQITQKDPKHGLLVFEAKIGILGDQSKDKR